VVRVDEEGVAAAPEVERELVPVLVCPVSGPASRNASMKDAVTATASVSAASSTSRTSFPACSRPTAGPDMRATRSAPDHCWRSPVNCESYNLAFVPNILTERGLDVPRDLGGLPRWKSGRRDDPAISKEAVFP
jgi:hypothetical protein